MNKKYYIAKQLLKIANNLILDCVFSQNNIINELNKIKIKYYQPFKKIHDDQWISYPVNRNANIPDIYVLLKNDKLLVGYNYINESGQNDNYEGVPQQTMTGFLQQVASLKKKIEDIVINQKNIELDKEKQEKNQGGEQGEEGGDDGFDLSLDTDQEQGGEQSQTNESQTEESSQGQATQ